MLIPTTITKIKKEKGLYHLHAAKFHFAHRSWEVTKYICQQEVTGTWHLSSNNGSAIKNFNRLHEAVKFLETLEV